MSRLRIPLLVFLAVTVMLLFHTGGGVTAVGPSKVPVIIAFNQQPGPAQEALVRQAGGAIKYTYDLVPAIAATVPEPAIAGLQANPNVLRVEPDIEVHAIDHDTTTGDAELENTWGVAHIGAGAVHDGNKGSGVKVAILDTGIDTGHLDLNYDSGCSRSFVSGESIEDGNGHGTHTAGTVAALDDGLGVVGVAPEAIICALKVLSDSGSGFYSDIIAALNFVVDQGDIFVTNNSYGSTGDPGSTVEAAFDAAYAAGVLHAAAAGNSGNPPGRGDNCIYPARWEKLIATAATKENDNRANFSSTCEELELSAPGYRINSTVPGGYAVYSGTSMASPHVAGTAALVFAANPDWSNDDVRTKLQNTADDLGATGRDTKYGYGLVDAGEAAASSGPDTTAPIISGVAATNITDTSATITWTTNESADSLVDYGLDTNYGSSVSDSSMVTIHSVTLTNLEPSTDYYYKVTSEDPASNSASSAADLMFTTEAEPTPDEGPGCPPGHQKRGICTPTP